MKGSVNMQVDVKKTEKILITAALFALICYVLSRYGNIIAGIFMPFIVARIFAQFLYQPVEYLNSKSGVPKWAACIFVVLTFYAVVMAFAYIIVSRLINELKGLSGYLSVLGKNIPAYLESAKEFLKHILPSSGFLGGDTSNVADVFEKAFVTAGEALADYLAKALPAVAAFVPKAIIFAAVTVLATCYFAADLKKINRFILFQLPVRAKVFISECRKQFFDTVSKYFGAYLTLAAITFSVLFAGLMLIRREYAFLLALLITFVDILPIFGAGAVLIPWAGVEALAGNRADSLKILVLYIIVSAVRQIAEPKVLGSFTGLYPLLALFSIYAGVKLIGITGVFVFPVIAIVLKNLNDKNLINIYKVPPENDKEKVFCARQKYKRFRKNT